MMKNEIAQKMKPLEKSKLIIIRHGSTKLNSETTEDKIRGWVDIPLDERGKEEASAMGKRLKNKHIDVLVSSDLSRSQETARIISKIIKVPLVEVTEEFRPWHVGVHTGQLTKKVMPILEDYVRNKPHLKINEGESFSDFKKRFLGGVQRIDKDYPGAVIAIVTHHRGDRIMASWEKMGCKPDFKIDIDTFLQKGIKPGDFRHKGEKI